ncbi:MAG: hypothetical protein HYU66_04195, partial [Armatimonadetes bacterium]|nr:hypothetical protein [Armatimonadota bacterium]
MSVQGTRPGGRRTGRAAVGAAVAWLLALSALPAAANVTSTFDSPSGKLDITLGVADNVNVALGPTGNVLVNFADPDTGPVAASNVLSISVTGNSGDEGIDLIGVDAVGFPALPSIAVDAGPGNDHVEGSLLADQIDGGPGIDQIFGNGGADQILGGDDGDDLYADAFSNAFVDGGAGGDVLTLLDNRGGASRQPAPGDMTLESNPGSLRVSNTAARQTVTDIETLSLPTNAGNKLDLVGNEAQNEWTYQPQLGGGVYIYILGVEVRSAPYQSHFAGGAGLNHVTVNGFGTGPTTFTFALTPGLLTGDPILLHCLTAGPPSTATDVSFEPSVPNTKVQGTFAGDSLVADLTPGDETVSVTTQPDGSGQIATGPLVIASFVDLADVLFKGNGGNDSGSFIGQTGDDTFTFSMPPGPLGDLISLTDE